MNRDRANTTDFSTMKSFTYFLRLAFCVAVSFEILHAEPDISLANSNNNWFPWIPAWLHLGSWFSTRPTCGVLGLTCIDCNTRMVCTVINYAQETCTGNRPYCNGGYCSDIPTDQCLTQSLHVPLLGKREVLENRKPENLEERENPEPAELSEALEPAENQELNAEPAELPEAPEPAENQELNEEDPDLNEL